MYVNPLLVFPFFPFPFSPLGGAICLGGWMGDG